MSEKQEIIKQMINMQKKFIEYEHQNGVTPEEYYTPQVGHELDGYKEQYDELARRLIDLAHDERGSSR
jgi:hypothetical protein